MQITKQQIKQLLLLMTTCFFIGISLTSCEKDLYEDGIKNSSRNVSVTHVSLSGINKSTSSKITEKITELKSLSNKTNAQGKFEYNSALDIYIDTENGRLVNNNGKLFYTFPMFRKTEEKLENIIFAPLVSGEMETYFARYNVTPIEFKDLPFEEIGNLSLEIQKYAYISPVWVCIEIQNWQQVSNEGISAGGLQPLYTWEWVTTSFTCTLTNSGGGYGGDDNTGSVDGPSENSGGGAALGISTTPIGLSPKQLREKNLIDQLDDSGQLDCFNSQSSDFKASVNQYLESTLADEEGLTLIEAQTYSPEAIADVKAALQDVCSSSSPGDTPSIIPYLIERKIDDTLLDPCTKGILDILKQNHAIANIIARFDSPNTPFKIKFKQDTISPYYPNSITYGETIPTGNPFEYEITLNSDYFKNDVASNLFKAKTIVHEIIHALILSIIENRHFPNGNTDPNDFFEIWNNYVSGFFNGNPNVTHHLFMGNNYTTIISQALQEYFTGIPYLLSPSVDQMYSDLAWSGIVKLGATTTPFDSVLSSSDKGRIYNRIQTESNRSLGYGLPLSSNNPCVN